MSRFQVRNVVCDYGVFEDGELKLVCNSRRNALLIAAILERDSAPSGIQMGEYVFTDDDYKNFYNQNKCRNKRGTDTMEEIRVGVRGGILIATLSPDSDYPGIDVEFVANTDNGEALSRPRVLIEYPKDDKLRALIWNDPNNEDYTTEIELGVD